jgi:non-ribosomal peptide synthetase component F
VIGIMSIEMVGAVYCPLSPRDPDQRLHALVEQTQSHLVLVHWMTRDRFKYDDATLDIEATVNEDVLDTSVNTDRLSNVAVTPESIAYVIFTSGSTGMPKAVSL